MPCDRRHVRRDCRIGEVNEKYDPKLPQVHWCSICDMKLVDSENEETGHFYIQHGHIYDPELKEFEGDYVAVMFAICSECAKRIDK